jgi:hypothetical protein
MNNLTLQLAEFNNSNFGRFGNQLFKYLFLKWAQKNMGLLVNLDQWPGDDYFNLPTERNSTISDTKFISHQEYSHLYNPHKILLELHELATTGCKVVDLYGYFQFHTSHYQEEKDFIYNLFKPNDMSIKFISNVKEIIDAKITAIHIRRGDYETYNNHPFFWASNLEKILIQLIEQQPNLLFENILYVSSDDLNYCKKILNKYAINYISNNTFSHLDSERDKLFVDFLLMCNANSLIISNSSLSFFAAMLNNNSEIFLRPSPDQISLVNFDPWNSNVLLSK